MPQSARRRTRPPATSTPSRPALAAAFSGPRHEVVAGRRPSLLRPRSPLNARLSGSPDADSLELGYSSVRMWLQGHSFPGGGPWEKPFFFRWLASGPLMWLTELTLPSLSSQSVWMTVCAAYEPRHSRPPLSPDPCQTDPSGTHVLPWSPLSGRGLWLCPHTGTLGLPSLGQSCRFAASPRVRLWSP